MILACNSHLVNWKATPTNVSSLLIRNSQQAAKAAIPTIKPPVLDASPKEFQGCGWGVMAYLGLTFILLCCLAVVVGIFACICCCSRGGRTSNIWIFWIHTSLLKNTWFEPKWHRHTSFGGCSQLMDYIGPDPDQEPAIRHINESRLLNKPHVDITSFWFSWALSV